MNAAYIGVMVIVASVGVVSMTAAVWAMSTTMAIENAERWGRLVASIGVPSLIAGYVLVKVNDSIGKLVQSVNDLRAAVISLTAFVQARRRGDD